MAIVIDNIYTKGISGRVGDALLYKQYGNKTVVAKFPRLTDVAPSTRQLAQRKKFALAVLKTRQWLQQKATRQFLLGLKQKWNSLSAYHAGIKYMMLQPAVNDAAPQTPTDTNKQATGNACQQLEVTVPVSASLPVVGGASSQPDNNPPDV